MSTQLPLLRPNPLDQTLGRRQAEQEALVALSQAALESSDVPTLLRMAVDRVAAVARVDVVTIIEEIDEFSGMVRACHGDPHLDNTLVDLPRSATGESVTIVADLAAHLRYNRRTELRALDVVSGLDVVIPSRRRAWGTLGMWTRNRHLFSREDAQFAEVIACLVGWVVARFEVEARLAEAVREKDRGLRLEMAVSRCARALLGDYDPAAVEISLRALMEATNASFGYIDWKGLEGRIVPSLRLSRDGKSERLDRHWETVSWDDLPTLRRGLEVGETVVVNVRDLPGDEAKAFLTAPEMVMTEIDVPIMINGAWTGTIGLGARDENRVWDREIAKAVEHASSLFSTWWEKRDYALRLEEALESRNRQIKLEQAVAATAQLLNQADDPGELDQALKLLLEGTRATSVFVERNAENEGGELCSKVVAVAQRAGSVYDPSYWDMMPWTSMPDTYELLSRGEVAILIPEKMHGPEAETYAVTSVRSEVDVPILIDGVWCGLIGIADENSARDWRDEIQLLHTAAEMIAAFWGRIETARRLEDLARSKDEFIASISHELRTPLTAVVGLAEAMVDPAAHAKPEEAQEFMSIIAEQSSEMAAIVQDLLVVARSDIGRVTIRPQSIDLLAEAQNANRGVRWEGRASPDISGSATALADPLRVRQIVRNLLTNALRYGGPQVTIRLDESDGWATLRVSDNGNGIPPEDRERIFRPYERAHHRQGQPASVGLGLTVSRQLASLMGGSLDYEVRGGWSVFSLRLPGARLAL